ncbi:hypothetical protein AMK09_19590 [Streptomyces sp. CB02488]|uniref:hypothetical protein n=1 Tax=Streptomyces sp. CB02488 TaxID=1703920 RepID=UPI000939BA81|nr:hypothetical protein [Streptomyces sp. CB02488]OKK17912.1 hypothetical protein AMK09_19590 [Streptomyces sp. CB02488]
MTAPSKAPAWHGRVDGQWADYGVNVGYAVYGGIHFHPSASAAARFRRGLGTAHSAGTTWHVAVQAALAALAHTCSRAAAALTYLGPDEAGKKE